MVGEGGRGREKVLGPKQKPQTSLAKDQRRHRTGRKQPRGHRQPPIGEGRGRKEMKRQCEWPGERAGRDPKWSGHKSMSRPCQATSQEQRSQDTG